MSQEFGNQSLNFKSDQGMVLSVYNTLSKLFKKPSTPPLKSKTSQNGAQNGQSNQKSSPSTIVRQVPTLIFNFIHQILYLSYRQIISIYSYFNSSYAYHQIRNSHQNHPSKAHYKHPNQVKLTKPDFILPLVMHRERVNFLVRKRPHVDYFLQQTAQWYDLVIYTASLELYGSAVIDMLEKDANVHFKGRYYRQDCIQEGVQSYTKDLRVVNEDLSSSFIIDNSPNAFRYFQDNAIHIHAFVGAEDDDHLQLESENFEK